MPNPKTLMIIFGPPAVGKMTVGAALSTITGLPLFHNHLTIEPVLPIFGFDHPSFWPLVTELRRRIFQEVAASELPGLIFTFAWSLDHHSDKAYIDALSDIFKVDGAKVYYVELMTTFEERLRRNECESRLAAKASKRDLVRSREYLLETEGRSQMNSSGDFFYPEQHIKIDNSKLTPDEVARQIVERFQLAVIKP